MSVDVRIITKNQHKADEFRQLFASTPYKLIQAPLSIEEIQTENMEALVSDKTIKAFEKIRLPLFVDHTGLYLDLLGGFPAGLTELFWERLKNRGLCDIIGRSENRGVTAVTLICYCDGKTLRTFKGQLRGTVPSEPRGPEGFQWDPIFLPDGCTQTFAEMGPEEKNKISMRRQAVDAFITHLDSQHG